ncbi:EthD domain-containing protein [[Mycobacterium] crassicus]|uniref:EthD domain-containing protein n=1 Tax=[Mycobacterium] crassicus TaxID=2872309 RepID=A0ABU5XM50_9MYCO|nr:EthD domain-containing protein [Mycolicibacter sp. MYC098]MEB3022181.1 EthD domain-containing protein [Mycolicibacter sp. MYC098]
MYALWGPDLDRTLHTPDLRESIRAAGATRLQVNVDDADVAPTRLRINAFDTPVNAVVSVWTEAEPSAISELLSGVADRCVGWEVEETVRLVPPPVADGQRAPALAQIGLLRIPADLTPEEWLHRWQGQHTAVAIETQATFGYIQNRVLRAVRGGERVDALVEELFPMAAMTDPHAFYGSGGDDAELRRRLGLMIESVTRFGAHVNLDSIPTSRYCYELASS